MPSRLPLLGTTIFSVMSRLAAECGAINLSQGFPDFSPPARLVERVGHHMAAGANQYAPMHGTRALREAIAEKVIRTYGAHYDVEQEITVTAGATEAIYSAVAACVRAGDEVIVFSPVYDSYIPAIELNGGVAVVVDLIVAEGGPNYSPDWDVVRDKLTARTRMIIINTPNNPTGSTWSAADMKALADIVRDTDVVILSDEVYEHMVFDGERHESVMRFAELRQRSFAVSSFGKSYHVTGWKIAYCLAPAQLTAELRKTHQFIVFAVNHPMQLAIADFMLEAPEFVEALSDFYQHKRDFLRSELIDSRFKLRPCAGTYFQLVDYSAISDLDDLQFARWLTCERGVAAIPVSVFSPKGSDARLVRLCFAKSETTLADAGKRLRSV